MAEQHHKAKEKAARLLQEGKLDAARDLYRQVVAEDPAEVACVAKLAEIAERLGAREEAIENLGRLADRYARDGFLLKAIASCKQILRLDPEHTATQEVLAGLYASRKSDSAPLRREARKKREDGAPSNEPGPKLADLITPPARTSAAPAERELPRTPLFSDLPKDAFKDVVAALDMFRFDTGAVILREGDPGDALYILASGRVRVEKEQLGGEPLVLAHLGEGAFFGEMALLQRSRRTASVVAEEPSEVLQADRAKLDDLVARHPSAAKALRDFYQRRLLSTATATHPLFRPLTPTERRRLCGAFRGRAFAAGEVLIEEGARGEGLYLLLSGRLEVSSRAGGVLAGLGPGEMVGEMSLLSEGPTTATVRAVEDSWVLRLSREDFHQVASERREVLDMVAQLALERSSSRPVADFHVDSPGEDE